MIHRKRFESEARFNAEIANYQLFEHAGLRVPQRYRIERQDLYVDYEKIRGVRPDARHMDRIVPLIVRVHNEILPRLARCGVSETDLCKYSYDVAGVVRSYSRWTEELRGLINRTFFPSVFRDAKPDNWIVTDSGDIVLIDFDYVVISGPLQDFAQFVTGIWINSDVPCASSALYDYMDLIFESQPWTKFHTCSRREKNMLGAAAMLLSLSRKRVYLPSQLEEYRISDLERLIVSSWPK